MFDEPLDMFGSVAYQHPEPEIAPDTTSPPIVNVEVESRDWDTGEVRTTSVSVAPPFGSNAPLADVVAEVTDFLLRELAETR